MNSNEKYIKANRKANREIELSFENGWKSVHKIHYSKKTYNRKKSKNIDLEL